MLSKPNVPPNWTAQLEATWKQLEVTGESFSVGSRVRLAKSQGTGREEEEEGAGKACYSHSFQEIFNESQLYIRRYSKYQTYRTCLRPCFHACGGCGQGLGKHVDSIPVTARTKYHKLGGLEWQKFNPSQF